MTTVEKGVRGCSMRPSVKSVASVARKRTWLGDEKLSDGKLVEAATSSIDMTG